MECGQHTAQSKQPASEKILSTEHLYTTLLQDHIDHKCSTPQEREGFSETDSTQYCNSRNTQNQKEAQLQTALPMHQIQPNGSIKDYFKRHRREQGTQTEDKKSKAPRRMNQEETQKERKLYCSKSVTLYFAFMNIVLEIHKLITALPKF